MSGIVAGALVAHPPVLLPAVAPRDSMQVIATADAIRALDRELAAIPADLVVVVSPHSPSHRAALLVRAVDSAHGDLARFGAPDVCIDLQLDRDTSRALIEAAGTAGFRLLAIEDDVLDHGLVVPLHFLERTRQGRSFLLIGVSGWPLPRFIEFGGWLHRRLDSRRSLFVASGDLSHRLSPGAPAGFAPEGRAFDELVIRSLSDGSWDAIEQLDPSFSNAAGECGLRPLAILLGAARAAGLRSRVLHYEGPFGVGYPVVAFSAASSL
jgi:aromatic ring-opening dioxygenase LigB subunit